MIAIGAVSHSNAGSANLLVRAPSYLVSPSAGHFGINGAATPRKDARHFLLIPFGYAAPNYVLFNLNQKSRSCDALDVFWT